MAIPATPVIPANPALPPGGHGGAGGAGGQGGAGGVAGIGGLGGQGGSSSTGGVGGSGGAGGAPGAGGHGGGGGGGLGAGGDIFVQQGGVLLIEGGNLAGGTATGGAGQNGGSAGSGYGGGIFLHADETITLAPAAGDTLAIAGGIADMTGSHDASGQTGAGGIIVNGAGTVTLSSASSFTGGTKIKDGTLLLGAPGAAGSGAIAFVPLADPVLEFSPADVPTNPIVGFGPGDFLKIDGESITGDAYAPANGEGVLTLTFGDSSTLDLTFTGNYTKDSFSFSGGEVAGVACYAAGTRIATAHQEVEVEQLRVGDSVKNAAGELRKIIRIGHRHIDCRQHRQARKVWPVRIEAGAFGEFVPHRDLWLSPDHAVLFEETLVPIRHLINGTTIAQLPVDEITYYHLELPRHDVLLAEGLPAESYLDTGNASDFPALMWEAESCAPLIVTGAQLEAFRRRLIAQ